MNREAALFMNINAAKGLYDVMKTNFGPKGTIKMLVGGSGGTVSWRLLAAVLRRECVNQATVSRRHQNHKGRQRPTTRDADTEPYRCHDRTSGGGAGRHHRVRLVCYCGACWTLVLTLAEFQGRNNVFCAARRGAHEASRTVSCGGDAPSGDSRGGYSEEVLPQCSSPCIHASVSHLERYKTCCRASTLRRRHSLSSWTSLRRRWIQRTGRCCSVWPRPH